MTLASVLLRNARDKAAGISRVYPQHANRASVAVLPRTGTRKSVTKFSLDIAIAREACPHLGAKLDKQPCGAALHHCNKFKDVTSRSGVCLDAKRQCLTCHDHPVRQRARQQLELSHPNVTAASDFAANITPYPEGAYSGTGVVIVGGGKYWASTYVTVKMLRHTGCTLPIQVWYLGEKERDDRYSALLAPLGCESIDATTHPAAAACRSLTGFKGMPPFESKSFAVLHSPFEQVLYLDADCYPCADVTPLFSDPRYLATGGIYWPDMAHTNAWTKWKDWGVEPFTPACGWEVGQYVLNKRLAWRQLQMTRWYDNHGDWCYGWGKHHDHGDKGTHRTSWARFRTEPTFFATKSLWKGCAFVHPGADGTTPLLTHRCRSKFVLSKTHFHSTPQNGVNQRHGLPGEDDAFRFLEELRKLV